MVQLLLIGAGKMGMNHLRNAVNILNKDSITVFDPDREALSRCRKFGVKLVDDFNKLAELKSYSHAIVATPTSTHAGWIQRLNGKIPKLLVEKPIVADSNEARHLLNNSLSIQTEITGGFIERFNPAIIELGKQIKNFDDIFEAKFTRTNKVSSRILDVDVIIDLMVHDLDLALLFFGPVKKISASGVKTNGTINHAVAILNHNGGCNSIVTASRMVHKKIRNIEINSKHARLECDLLKKDLLIVKDHQEEEIPGKPYKLISSNEVIEIKSHEALFSELNSFLLGLDISASSVVAHSLQDMHDVMILAEKIKDAIDA